MIQKRLLILGSVEDFSRLTQLAVEKGIYTVVADGFDGEAKQFASKSYTVNIADNELIDLICREEKIDHVISSFSDNLFEKAVYISERNHLPCFCPADKVVYLRDKMLMKDMLKSLDIPTAKGQMLNMQEFSLEKIRVPFPFVLKPVAGWGSRGMKIVNNADELMSEIEKVKENSSAFSQLMLESINTGYEINVMSWIKDDNVYLLEFGDRETSGKTDSKLPYLSREVFPTIFYEELEAKIKNYLYKIAKYIGILEGPLSMQFFYSDGDLTVGEVAGRFFGLGQGIVPIINGIDLNELLINMLYFPEDNNKILKNVEKNKDHCSIAIYIKSKKGIVRDYGNLHQFRQINRKIDDFHIFAKPGQSTEYIPWIVRIYAHFDTRSEADSYTKELYENLFVPNLDGENLVAPNNITIYEV